MLDYLRARAGEWNTRWGIRGMVLAVALIAGSFLIDPERWGDLGGNVQMLGFLLLGTGLSGILWPLKKPPECG